MTIDLAALKVELETDPVSLNYTGDDRADAKLLNDPTKGRQAARTVLSRDVAEVLASGIVGSGNDTRNVLDLVEEYAVTGTVGGQADGSTEPDRRRSGARMLCAMFKIPESRFSVDSGEQKNAVTALGAQGGNGPAILDSAMMTALGALAKKASTRARELFSESVTTSEIADARRLP